jgi:ketosteroid isomerase-like protein
MTDRRQFEQLLHELHGARLDADLERLCALFLPDAQLRIVGTSDGKPILISASGLAQIRSWLGMLIKTFRLSGYELQSTLIEGDRAAVHWRVLIRSKITGHLVSTELVDLVEVRAGRIAAHTEMFVPL